MSDNFVQRDNLESLDDDQRAEYNAAFCDHLGIPKNLGLLKYFYANNIEGKRTLILYATRGATDIIRGNRGITVDSLDQVNGPGFVNFTARAHDSTGRHEMATGAAGIEGLRGEKLGNAVMAAQTKALRRVTLQFVGGGLLDESEIPSYETNIPVEASLAELSKPAPPAVASINNLPGSLVPNITGALIPNVPGSLIPNIVGALTVGAAPTDFKSMDELRADATKQLEEKTAKRTRKPRKPVNTVELGEDSAKKLEVPRPSQELLPDNNSNPTPEATEAALDAVKSEPVPEQVKVAPKIEVAPLTPVEGMPTPEQLKDYRGRLGKYANDILPTGGMMPSGGIGGVSMKIRKFAELQLGLPNVMSATADQWEELFTFLDEYTATKGAPELVKYIDKSLGV